VLQNWKQHQGSKPPDLLDLKDAWISVIETHLIVSYEHTSINCGCNSYVSTIKGKHSTQGAQYNQVYCLKKEAWLKWYYLSFIPRTILFFNLIHNSYILIIFFEWTRCAQAYLIQCELNLLHTGELWHKINYDKFCRNKPVAKAFATGWKPYIVFF
jgi:hypothetical protein